MIIKRRKPRFARQHKLPHSRVRDRWQKPRGTYSKQAMKKQHRGAQPDQGYGQPADVWGLHPSGFEEVLVHNEGQLRGIDAKRQCVRIGADVGLRKKIIIAEAAKKAGLKVLNAPKHWQKKPTRATKPAEAKPTAQEKPAAKKEMAKPAKTGMEKPTTSKPQPLLPATVKAAKVESTTTEKPKQ